MQTQPDISPKIDARAVRWCALLLSAVLLAGCSTQRTLEISTEPAGADIWVDGVKQPSGTPARIPFTHYRYFTVRIEKPGYVPIATEVDVETEIDGYPLIDLPFELLTPSKEFRRHFRLERLPRRPGLDAARTTLDQARAFSDQARRRAADGAPPPPDINAPRFPPRRPEVPAAPPIPPIPPEILPR